MPITDTVWRKNPRRWPALTPYRADAMSSIPPISSGPTYRHTMTSAISLTAKSSLSYGQYKITLKHEDSDEELEIYFLPCTYTFYLIFVNIICLYIKFCKYETVPPLGPQHLVPEPVPSLETYLKSE